MRMDTSISDVETYIKGFSKEIQVLLKQVRKTVKENAPKAVETISYGMPAYKLNGKPLVYFAAFKSHIGFYATPTAHEAFAKELSKYKQGKGSVQFPISEPMPLTLIAEMVKYKVARSAEMLNK